MSTKLTPPIVPSKETCPNCRCSMTITEITPVLFTDDLEDVAYRCKRCLSEMKRTYKRCSGTWQLIHYTPVLAGDQGYRDLKSVGSRRSGHDHPSRAGLRAVLLRPIGDAGAGIPALPSRPSANDKLSQTRRLARRVDQHVLTGIRSGSKAASRLIDGIV
jgi:hypothetical protein